MINFKTKTQAKIKWYNQTKKLGEAATLKGQTILITEKSFNESDIPSLKNGIEIECNLYNSREQGLYAYSASIIK